ncbi:MAG: hypothetical protein U0835_23215 [Isosphaeraceae bacterium]
MFAGYAAILDRVLGARPPAGRRPGVRAAGRDDRARVWPPLRKEFPRGRRQRVRHVQQGPSVLLEKTEERIAQIEGLIRDLDPEYTERPAIFEIAQRRLVGRLHAELRPMDAVVKVYFPPSAWSRSGAGIRASDPHRRGRKDLGGSATWTSRSIPAAWCGAMNEVNDPDQHPCSTGKDQKVVAPSPTGSGVVDINGVVDARIIQRLDYPEYVIEVDRAKAADLGLTQEDVIKTRSPPWNCRSSSTRRTSGSTWSAATSTTSACSTLEGEVKSMETLLNILIADQRMAVPLGNLIHMRRTTNPTEVTHANIQPTIDPTMSSTATWGTSLRRRVEGPDRVRDARPRGLLGDLRPGFEPRRSCSRVQESCSAASTRGCRTPSATWVSD